MKQKVLATRAIHPEIVARLEQWFEVEVMTERVPGDLDVLEARLSDKDGVLVIGDPIRASAVAASPRLKAVANMAVGYNNLDLGALNAAGIIATNTPDVLNETTADLAWALLMATARRITEAERFLRAGRWQSWEYDLLAGTDVFGTTLGIIGMGRIGQAIARRASGFRMRVLYHNRSRLDASREAELDAGYADKDTLLKEADHLVLALPYSAQSHHTIGARELGLMKAGAILVNIARGGIVDDAALIKALEERRIAGAGLDVFENEPNFDHRFLALSNVVLTPHIGSASDKTRLAMATLAADNLIAALGHGPHAGRPPNVVNRAVATPRV